MITLKTALLSVIIPVYNVEPYLEQCLDRVVNQTYKNLEIICINDGSTDKSMDILLKYQRKDKRIIIISQPNKGLSEARNSGLRHANGEYIAFLDSDDYISTNAYEVAMKPFLDGLDIDFTEFKWESFNDRDGSVIQMKHKKYNPGIHQREMFSGYVWNKIYKTSILKKMNINFIPNVLYEDIYFSYSHLISTKKSFFIDDKLLFYRRRDNSITQEQYKKSFKDYLDVFTNISELVKFAKKHNLYHQNKDIIYGKYMSNVRAVRNDTNWQTKQAIIAHCDNWILRSDCHINIKKAYMQQRQRILGKQNFMNTNMKQNSFRDCFNICTKF